ncbi:MAG: 30S ribosomal protein S5 [Victivallaceae bacterium]|nr:30S ribosomal protein S5 [Victivallaceae bacterium]
MARRENAAEPVSEFEEKTVAVLRHTKVVKGGKNMSFGAFVVVGNRKGSVGFGYGKANEVSEAIRKGSESAHRSLIDVPMHGQTIPHEIEVKFGGAKVLLRPASAGTGLIAGGAVRDVLELAGVRDVLAKSLGASNAPNVAKATFKAIASLMTREQALSRRGIKVEKPEADQAEAN